MQKKQFDIYVLRLKRYFKSLDRIGKMWYVVLFVSFILIFSLFSFTIINHDFYKNLADKLQRTTISNPVSRGSVSSSDEAVSGVLAVSTDLGTLAVDATQSGSTVKLLELLSEAVMNEFCGHHTHAECVTNIGSYVRDETIALNPALTKDELSARVKTYLSERISTPVESVFLAGELSDEAVKRVDAIADEALFFSLNNLYVNPTKVKNAQDLSVKLSPILDISVDELQKKMAIRPKQYLEVIRKMSITTRDLVENALKKNQEFTFEQIKAAQAQVSGTPEKNAARTTMILEHAIYPFVSITQNLVRFYPEGKSMGQITGYVDGEGVGRYGIEGYFEDELQGDIPTRVITKDIK